MGFFGRTASTKKGTPDQPRHLARVNVAEALRASRRELQAWSIARQHEHVPLFSGGLADSWPAWAVEAVAVARAESHAIWAYLNKREREEARHG